MKIKFLKLNNNLNKIKNGLTLVELLVVVSIFLVITGVTIFNYGDFRSNVSLQNLTDDIALSVRKAQSFAIGARSSSMTGTFDNSFGIHFSLSDTNEDIEGNNKSFLMFSVPLSESKKYDYSGNGLCGDSNNACLELFRINTADYIKSIILDNNILKTEGSLDIVFTRPDPRASFCYRANQSPTESCISASRIDIIISNGLPSDKEKTRTITVQNTGQISTQ